MKKYFYLFVVVCLVLSCKHKKISLADDDSSADVNDFVSFFPDVKLPYQLSDSLFENEGSDSSLISYKLFEKFVPDSVLSKYLRKKDDPDIFALGKNQSGKNEKYLFVRAVTDEKEMVLTICMSNDNKFLAVKPLFSYNEDENASDVAILDNKYTLTVLHQRKVPGADMMYKKDAYIFNNDAKKFMLILTESNEASTKAPAVIDPIDTLPHKKKFSGNYAQDKVNFISVRDGRDASHILFFVHFEKNNGDCKGELKGEAKLISPTTARYSSGGDPCTVDFYFTPTSVSMKELSGCGNHRDIKCFFEGIFPKQKPQKKAPAKQHR
ncbi:MAG: hypothetical protein JST87_06110 [Bacteroidetes bacterium]|nr:hypothetical protein [Bacteroidota bacterium]